MARRANNHTAVIDFDGVIAQYDHWRGQDHFGEPVPWAREALLELREWGWHLVIYTTRAWTPSMVAWLDAHGIPYHAINSCAHNPPGTSQKPIAEVYFDDRSWYDVKRRWSWPRVMKRMRRLYRDPHGLDSFLDAAACWGPWWYRVFGITWGA